MVKVDEPATSDRIDILEEPVLTGGRCSEKGGDGVVKVEIELEFLKGGVSAGPEPIVKQVGPGAVDEVREFILSLSCGLKEVNQMLKLSARREAM